METKQYSSLSQMIGKGQDEAARFIDKDGKIYVAMKYKQEEGSYKIIMVEIRKARFE